MNGITHQCLAHWHEAAPALARIKQRFGATLCCHERDAEVVHSKGGIPVDRTFQARETLWGGIEVIPTPGHTPGSTCFLFESSHGGTYLFTGDTIFPSRGSWAALAFENGSKAELAESLELLRRLEPDVVIAAGALDTTTCKEMAPGEWQSGVDAALHSLS